MAISDPVANMLTKIRNASLASHEKVDILFSCLKLEIIKVLKSEGYVKNFKRLAVLGVSYIRIYLKYDDKSKPVIHGVRSVSTPGCRVYRGYRTIPRVLNGIGSLIISSSKGVLTGKKAVDSKVGGEIICELW